MADKIRCPWAVTPLMTRYHDTEWGVPLHDDKSLFEFLLLEGAQAGLSWETVLKKRDGYRRAFYGFDPEKVSRLTGKDVERILSDPGIIRNRLKVGSAITNAGCFIRVREEFGSFDKYVWGFVDCSPTINGFKDISEIPASTPASDALSRDLKKRGFKFVGSTICYAFMQAVGMVNDHLTGCFRFKETRSLK